MAFCAEVLKAPLELGIHDLKKKFAEVYGNFFYARWIASIGMGSHFTVREYMPDGSCNHNGVIAISCFEFQDPVFVGIVVELGVQKIQELTSGVAEADIGSGLSIGMLWKKGFDLKKTNSV